MTDSDLEKASYGGFERFLFFATPIIFTVVLLGVLLALFDINVMNGVLKAANRVPILEKFVPDPAVRSESWNTDPSLELTAAAQLQQEESEIEALSAKIADAEATIASYVGTVQEKEKTIEELKAQISSLEERLSEQSQTDEQYRQQIQQLATIYGNMMPSRAAPILEALTLRERVLVLSEMKTSERTKVLEKMSPQIAAETSIQLKDLVPVKDLQIAALQERLAVQQEQERAEAPVAARDLGLTFSAMVPKSAASILLEMNTANPKSVIEILQAMDNQGRARVLAAMADADKTKTASISAKLVN